MLLRGSHRRDARSAVDERAASGRAEDRLSGGAWYVRLAGMSTADRLDVLRWQFRTAWSLGADVHFPALTNENCLWLPAPEAWTVRRNRLGGWSADWADQEPDPAPPVTIAWLTWHLIWWWRDLLSRSSGDGPVNREQAPWPGSADAVRSALWNLHAEWEAHLDQLTDDALEQPFTFPWPRPRPFVYTVAWCNAELMKNIAEIGLLRHLHASRAST